MTENCIIGMFTVPLVHLVVNDWKEKKKKLLKLCEKTHLSLDNTESLFTNYYENDKILNSDIQNIFKDEINILRKEFNLFDLKIKESWYEETEINGSHSIHNHGQYGYSSICYIQYDKEEHTSTVFISPVNNTLTGEIITYKPEVDEGSIIFFPSSILHYTIPNKSIKKRLIVSFNLI
jgi:V8-like Glu-specific endopeptidase